MTLTPVTLRLNRFISASSYWAATGVTSLICSRQYMKLTARGTAAP